MELPNKIWKQKKIGVGLQYNPEILEWFPFNEVKVDLFEILMDYYMGPLDGNFEIIPARLNELQMLQKDHFLLAHSNYGCDFGFDDINKSPAIKRHVGISKMIASPFVCNHMFYGDSSWSNQWSSPIQFSLKEAKRLGKRAKYLQDQYEVPIGHENPAYYHKCPGSNLTEEQFIYEMINVSGTYIHLDLHNIYTNSLNDINFNLSTYLDTIPLDKVIEIHLSGGSWYNDIYHDWHDNPVPPEVWDMLTAVLSKTTNIRAIILEFQGRAHHKKTKILNKNLHLNFILNDLEKAKQIWDDTFGNESRRTTMTIN